MITGQALEIVLNIVKSPHVPLFVQVREKEAIEEAEQLLTQFEDTGNYTEDDYMED